MNTKSFTLDPDYEISETIKEQVKKREELELTNSLERIRSVLRKEFQRELEFRENQMELIQQRLNKASKTLHLLRYCLVTTYYNRNELNFNAPKDEQPLMDKQNRIHPAVKRLLGSVDSTTTHSSTRRKRTKHTLSNKLLSVTSNDEQTLKDVPVLQKNDVTESNSDIMKNVSESENELTSLVRNRKCTKQRIVVGNISKWMPSESIEDNSTHKWMVYVRGPKESPDISHIIQKVVFYLHPSYKPNDIVELSESPFHLSRRGWGEFPLRIQLYFQCKLNKPVDIIHNLKLDRTYTGRQILGNETIIELSLYNNSINDNTGSPRLNHNDLEAQVQSLCNVTSENETQFEELNEESTHMSGIEYNESKINNFSDTSTEHTLEEQVDIAASNVTHTVELEHSYCRKSLEYSPMLEASTNVTDENTSESEKKLAVQQSDPKPCLTYIKRVVVGNGGQIFIIKKRKLPQQSLFKKNICKKPRLDTSMQSILRNKSDDKYKFNFPTDKFRTVTLALPFLFKRLPIINKLAENLNYKSMFPYVAKSVEEFSSWNIGKRSAAEWSRAKAVQKYISSSNIQNCANWSTKKIILYGRAYGYTPLTSYSIFNKHVCEMDDYQEKSEDSSNVSTSKKIYAPESDTPVNVVTTIADTDDVNKSNYITLVNRNYDLESSFIKQTALDVGVVLKSEEIHPGVLFNGAERMILQSVHCLVENLIRSARACLVRKGNFSESTSIIGEAEIIQALSQRSEFKKILSCNTDALKY